MIRLFFFLLGFGITAIGGTYWVIYLNLFTIGYTFQEYLSFVMSQFECVFALFGFMVMTVAIFWKGDSDFALHL